MTVIKENFLDSTSVEQVLQGSAAVINAPGGVKEPDKYQKFQKIGNILSKKMNEQGIKRLVSISGAVMTPPGKTLKWKRKVMKVFGNLFF